MATTTNRSSRSEESIAQRDLLFRRREPLRLLSGAHPIADDLVERIRGEVRFDAGSRALYATAASNYRQVPIGVVIPRDIDDVIATVEVCHGRGAPILARGGGTSLAGQTANAAVVMDMSKYMNQILDIDADRRLARVQPGVVLDDLRDAAEQHHLTFGPDPSTHNHCTLGGMIGNNSCGVHALMSGKTSENVHELEILTYDGLRMRVGATSEEGIERLVRGGGRRGQIYADLRALRDRYADLIRTRYPNIPRRVSGYNLEQLLPEQGFHVARALVGSECTCVTILDATVNLVHSPPARTLVILGYPDIFTAGDRVPEVLGFHPVGLEGVDDRLAEDMRKKGLHESYLNLFPPAGGWLLVEFGGETREEANSQAQAMLKALKGKPNAPEARLYDQSDEMGRAWKVRESGLGATARVPGEPDTWEGWEDSAVPPDRVGSYLRDLRKLFDRYGYNCSLYGHLRQGCIHTRIDFDLLTAPGIAKFRSFISDAADLVVSYGGSLSGEHGDGQSRAEFLPKMFGDELVGAFREFKAIWDPTGKMNPHKIVDPYRVDENLRLGTTYNSPQPTTHFTYPDDDGSFSRAILRCVGVGDCRKHNAGTMCPSYMATQEEEHSTRGRARLLFEMLKGEVTTGGWQDEHVKESLDLCLACKGCKGECPMQVDMATYKAEFLSHYYADHLRPMSAFAFGLIFRWASLAALAPWLPNLITQTPLLRDIAKRAVGVAPERRIPAFAPSTFKAWFRRRQPRNPAGPEVILWADTFNNHFHPSTAIAATGVLEDLGYHVRVIEQNLCCGRPTYDYGMLDTAKGLLREILKVMQPEIRKGTPIVGLEPSCVAVFRDELVNLFPHDEDAKRLSSQVLLLSELLEQKGEDFDPPKLPRRAIVHGHCHHKSLMGMGSEISVLQKLGIDITEPDAGCCGMAGAFGFEKGAHYDVSIKAGERVLLPAVRTAPEDALIIADGFSCREQIAQTTNRRALHLAEVIRLAQQGDGAAAHPFPEHAYADRPAKLGDLQGSLGKIAAATAILVGARAGWTLGKRGR